MLYEARYEDTLVELARTFRLGYVESAAANPGIDPWLPGEGTMITVPTARILPRGPRERLLINLADIATVLIQRPAREPNSQPRLLQQAKLLAA